jgi:hypothetical protein
MNILYLHGLESKLSDEKSTILEAYGTVFAPDIDYKSNPNVFQNLYDTYKNQDINVIIGSSMGGYIGYYLANSFGVCAMLYNPALPYRNNIEQIIPTHLQAKESPLLRFVLGGHDDIIKAKDNLTFLANIISPETDYTIVIKNDLAHQIPIDVFETETASFFDMLCY